MSNLNEYFWTKETTEGFTDEQLSIINAALEQLLTPHIDDEDLADWAKHYDDKLNNAWTDDISSAAELLNVIRHG